MKFLEILDFGDFTKNKKYVIDLEKLNNFPLFKSLSEKLNFDNNGKEEALKFLQGLLEGRLDYSNIKLLESLYDDNHKEIINLLDKEARVLDETQETLYDKISQKSNIAFKHSPKCQWAEHILEYTAIALKNTWDYGFLCFKKGWFRELENEAFCDDLFARVDEHHLRNFYNEIKEDLANRGEIFLAYDKCLSKYLLDKDLNELYHNNRDFFDVNFDVDEEIKNSNGNFDLIIKTLTLEAIAFTAEKCYSPQYAQEELDFYRVDSYIDNEQEPQTHKARKIR